jgi:hypothetical protein
MRRQLYHAAGCLALLLLQACGAAMEAPSSAYRYERSRRSSEPSGSEERVVVASRGETALASPDSESAGSSQPEPAEAPPPAPPPPPPPQKAGEAMKSEPTGSGEASAKSSAGEVAVVRGPLLIYTAQITLAVFQVNASLGQVEALGRELGGFLARRDDNSITIRIPVNRFDEAVKRIENIGDMLHRNVVAEDVTEEFRDLEVRLKGAHAVQERLTQLLARAAKVEEAVLIERELDRVTSEIDRIEGRMKFLKDRAAYSTLTVTFQSKQTESIGRTPFRLPGQWLNELGLRRLLSL